MKYNIQEYNFVYDTPMARQQELAIVNCTFNLLNNNKYNNIEDFVIHNTTYQEFLKKQNLVTAIKHFGNTLKEKDYIRIIENIKTLTNQKQTFDKNGIKTEKLNDKEFAILEGKEKDYYIDNSSSYKTIEEQMKDLQHTNQQFQTTDPKKNTENMFKELEEKKDVLNLQYLKDIDYYKLNFEEQQLFSIAFEYQISNNQIIRIDIKKAIICDENNNLKKIQKENGEFSIIDDETTKEKTEINTSKQYTLKPSDNTIYSN